MNNEETPEPSDNAKRFSASDPRSASYRKRARRAALRHLQNASDMLRWFATSEEIEAAASAVYAIADHARKRGEVAS